MSRLAIVTAAPPTPNGDLHLGHLSGPYSGADIYARAQRLTGAATLFLTGSDVHQSYVPAKAAQRGEDPIAMADRFGDDIGDVFAAMGFAVDAYPRPQRSALHVAMVQEFLTVLHRRGRLVRRDEPALHCAACDRYLFEAHVTGRCPACKAVSDGNSCESCARPNVCVDLLDPVCNKCGGTPETRATARLFLPLERYREGLAVYHARTVMSPQLEDLCRALLAGPLPDIPVTHPTDWGIPAPIDEVAGQRVYVWAEMVPGYFAALAQALVDRGEPAQNWRTHWDSPRTERVQFFGFDNGYFHTVLFPALMMAYDETLRLPDALITNEFLNLDTAKFSTSRGHAIWARELLEHVPADAVRYVLAYQRPEQRRTTFTWAGFTAMVDGELAGRWSDWLRGLFGRLSAEYGSVVPPAGAPSGGDRRFVDALGRIADECMRAYSAAEFSPARACRLLAELVRLGADHAGGHALLHADAPGSAEAAASLAAQLTAARALAQLAAPVMPDFAGRLWRALGEEGEPRWDGVRPVPPQRRVGTPPTLPAVPPQAASIGDVH